MTNGHPSNLKNNSKNQNNFGICLLFKFPKVSLNSYSKENTYSFILVLGAIPIDIASKHY